MKGAAHNLSAIVTGIVAVTLAIALGVVIHQQTVDGSMLHLSAVRTMPIETLQKASNAGHQLVSSLATETGLATSNSTLKAPPQSAPLGGLGTSLSTIVVALDLKWGTADDQVGLLIPKKLDSGPEQVPQSFDVSSSGDLLVLDSVSLKIKQFGPDGRFVRSFAVGGGDDVRMAPDGSIVVLNYGERALYRYRADGSFLHRIGIGERISQPFQGLHFGPGGVLLIEHRVKKGPNGKPTHQYTELLENGHVGKTYLGRPSPTEGIFLSYKNSPDPWVGAFQIYDASSTLTRQFEVAIPRFETAGRPYAYFIDTDAAGSFYFYLAYESANQKRWESRIVKFDAEGKYVSSIPLRTVLRKRGYTSPDLGEMFVKYRVAANGSVFVGFPLAQSFLLVRVN